MADGVVSLDAILNWKQQGENEVAASAQRVASAARSAGSAASSASKGINKAGQSAKKAAKDANAATKAFRNLGSALKRIVIYKGIRAVLAAISNAFKEGVTNMYNWSTYLASIGQADIWNVKGQLDDLTTSVTYLKNALAASLSPILPIIASGFRIIADEIANVFNNVSALLSMIRGSNDYTAAIRKTVEMDNSLKSAAGSAKELRKTLLGFDEINRLNDNTSGSGSTGTLSDWDGYFDTLSMTDEFKNQLAEKMAGIEAMIATFTLCIGAALAFTGVNIPLGITLMAVGAVGLAASIGLNWNTMSTQLQETLQGCLDVVALFTLPLGAVLAFSGSNIPLGIALMAVGAASLVTSAALNWDSVSGYIEENLADIKAAITMATLAVGAVLVFMAGPAGVALGLGLLIVGAAELATEVMPNYDDCSNHVQECVDIISDIISGALAVFGTILLLSGAGTAMGLGMLVAGASIFTAKEIIPNWNYIKDYVENNLADITTAVSTATLAVGAILICTGNVPLGLGLLTAGLVGIAASLIPNWDTVSDNVKRVVKDVGAFVGSALIVLGAIMLFTGVGVPMGLGLIFAGIATLGVTQMAPDWGSISKKLGTALDDAKTTVKTKLKELGEQFSSWKANIPTPHMDWTTQALPAGTLRYKILSALNLPTSLPKLNVNWYAQGGFPSKGELFFANERGPELVGSMGGNTAVANNGQIVEGIKQGVIEAMLQTSGGQNITLNVDGKQLFDIMVDRNNSQVRRTGMSPLLV